MMMFQGRLPTQQELEFNDFIDITMDEPLDPSKFFDDPSESCPNNPEDEDDHEDNHATLHTHALLPLSSKIQQLEKNSSFCDSLDNLPDSHVHGHAIHLDIDHQKGISITSEHPSGQDGMGQTDWTQ